MSMSIETTKKELKEEFAKMVESCEVKETLKLKIERFYDKHLEVYSDIFHLVNGYTSIINKKVDEQKGRVDQHEENVNSDFASGMDKYIKSKSGLAKFFAFIVVGLCTAILGLALWIWQDNVGHIEKLILKIESSDRTIREYIINDSAFKGMIMEKVKNLETNMTIIR